MSKLITVGEVAEFLNVSRMTVYRMIKRGQLRAERIGNQFRIDPLSVPGYLEGEKKPIEEQIPHRKSWGHLQNAWFQKYRPLFLSFVVHQLLEFKPDWIIAVHRKGARFFEALALIPNEYRDKVLYSSAFHWLTEGKLHSGLRGKKILIFDETIQRGRTLSKLRKFFESYGAQVRTIVLVRRRRCMDEGTLQDFKVISCVDLNDRDFAYMVARMLEMITLHSIPLDTDHFRFELKLGEMPVQIHDLEEILASIGPIYFLPSPVNGNELSCYTVEQIDLFDWEKLRLPTWIRKEGVCKIRIYYDPKSKTLHIIPVIFPEAELDSKRALDLIQTIDEPWSPYLIVPEDFSELSEEIQCEMLCRLFTGYCSVKLGLSFLSDFVKLAPQLLKNLQEISVECEDWKKIWGRDLGENIDKVVHSDIEQALLRLRTLPEIRMQHVRKRKSHVSNYLTVDSTEIAEKDVLIEMACQETIKTLRGDIGSKEKCCLSFSELQSAMPSIGLPFLSRAMDILLDGGLIKPDFEVRRLDFAFRGLRVYSLSEYGSWFDDAKAYANKEIANRKLARIVPYVFQRLMKQVDSLSKGVEKVLTQKVFVNLQHDWDYRRFDPLFLGWSPYLYGPMNLVPKKRSPYGGYYSLRQFAEEQKLIDNKLINRGIWAPRQNLGIDEVLDELDPEEADFIEGFIDIYATIYSDGRDETTNILMTLAACRNRKLTYICGFEEVKLWKQNVEAFLDIIERNISYFPRVTENVQKEETLEPLLESIANPHAQLRDKIDRYRHLAELKEQLKVMLTPHPRSSLARGLLERIEVPVDLSDQQPYPVGRLVYYEPVIGIFSNILRQIFSSLKLAYDTRPSIINEKTKDEKNTSWYVKKLVASLPELNQSQELFDRIVYMVDSQQVENELVEILKEIYSKISAALDRDLPPPRSPQASYFFRVDPQAFRKKMLELTSAVKSDVNQLACVVVDAHGFVPLSEWIAQKLDVNPDDVRGALQKCVLSHAQKLSDGCIHFLPVGGDGALVTFASADEAYRFSCRLQGSTDRVIPRFVKIGIAWGDPRADFGAPHGSAFITAYYLTEKIGLSPGKIAITEDVLNRLSDLNQTKCKSLGQHELRNEAEPIRVHEVEWRE